MPRVKLKNIVELAEGTMGFYFEKPAGFQFSAGQFGEWTLIDPPETAAGMSPLRRRRAAASYSPMSAAGNGLPPACRAR